MTMAVALPISEPATSTRGRHQSDAIYSAGDGETNVIALDAFRYPGTAVGPQQVLRADMTSTGPIAAACVPVGQTTAEAVLELRRRSGLTWDLLSELFNVSRRTVHHWANGKAPSVQREREIRWTLDAVRHLDEGSRRATRDRLLTASGDLSPFDLLAARCYADVLRQTAGAAATNSVHHQTALSEDEWARRRPTPPALLLDAIGDRPEMPVGKTRIARPARKKKPTE